MVAPEIVISMNDLEQGPLQRGNHERHEYEKRKVPPSVYYDKVVGPKFKHRPWLENLHQFMDPASQGFEVDLGSRMKDFDIKVIHISTSGEVDSVIKCVTPDMFKTAIIDDQERSGTLVIAKDISRAMIDALGTQYELEPEFFATHLLGTESLRKGHWVSPTLLAPARAPNLLPDYLRKAPFYTGEFRRPYHIEGGIDEVIRYRSRIILTDKLLSHVLPASYICNPVASLDDDLGTLASTGRSNQVSSRGELISWLQKLPAEERKTLFTDQEPLALQPILKIVERNGAMFLTHARYTMTRILVRQCDYLFPDSIPFSLSISRTLHRLIHEQQRLLRQAMRVARLKGGRHIKEQIEDFGFLSDDIEGELKALKEVVQFLTSAASIREGKFVGLVSKFAALFLPVSLLATILAISDPGYTRWAILAGLSVPFMLVSVYIMFFWRPAHLDSLEFE